MFNPHFCPEVILSLSHLKKRYKHNYNTNSNFADTVAHITIVKMKHEFPSFGVYYHLLSFHFTVYLL